MVGLSNPGVLNDSFFYTGVSAPIIGATSIEKLKDSIGVFPMGCF